ESATIEINSSNENMSLVFYDITGKEVKRMENLHPGTNKFNRGSIPGGVYFYSMQSLSGLFITSGKIILN
ncbi:MAG: T9SS type A sorting domain-containing protein, partial [Bacteroidales bacterium]|nr:T9SS type A sorting domain-containing protein [Bacteroidales bacterium]